MHVRTVFRFFAILSICSALLAAQGLTTTATKDDWEEINFAFNSSVLSDGYPSLLRLAELLHEHPDFRVKLDANADWIGSNRYNDKLSQARGETVKKFLVKYGASEEQISIVAHGKRNPKVSNETTAGRFMNRRVSMTVTDGQGKIISAGGIGEAIKAIQAAQAPPQETMCCNEILKRLDKLDEILEALKELKAENAQLKQDVAALKQAQAGTEQKMAEMPKPPSTEELKKAMQETAKQAVESAKPSRFSLLGLNIGPSLGDTLRPGFDRDIKMSNSGNFTFTGKGRYFAPFGKTESHAVQAEGEYMYFRDRQEGQFDLGLLNRWKNIQLGAFNSVKHVHISDLDAGGTLAQAAFTADVLFKYGRIGAFGTKGYLNDRVIARTPVQLVPGLTTFNVYDETSLRIVDQVGASATVGLWKDAYLDANFGALFRRSGTNRPGGTFRLVQPINSMWAFTVEAGVNETLVGPKNTGRLAFGVQLGNWLKPKEYAELKHPVPVEIPRLRYEMVTRRVHTGNAPPVADAGPDQIGVPSGTISLDGSGSYDPDGDAITYQWTQISGPAVTLSAPTAAQTTFTAADGQSYSFRLMVKDTLGAQGTSKVTVTTLAAPVLLIAQFTANPSTINAGQSSTLVWAVDNAETVEISGIGTVNPRTGSTQVSPAETTTYTLTARNRTGEATSTATVTVIPTPAPAILDFQGNPTTINLGQSSLLYWQTRNAEQVTISGIGPVGQNGSTSVSPTQTTTYTLTATNQAGSATATVTITVNVAPPVIVSFSANPAQIASGASSTLSWQVQNATSVSISGIGSVNPSGSQSVSPADTTTYTLTATGAGGTATATATVTVLFPATIVSFTASPTTITAGETVTLSWTTQHAVSASIYGIGPVVVNGSVEVTPTSDTTYVLTANGAIGPPVTAQVSVKVNPAPPTPTPPVADAGRDIVVNVRQVPLNATGSSDPNGLPLTYSWTSQNPAATFVGANSATPIAMLGPNNGTYVFTVTVTNSQGLSSSASVNVTLIRVAPTPQRRP
jgi:hypothetical protein